jgi:2-polyprenyl-6-hydroxyphenyl methylase/3-demethylubiquinone-9 3-methyltransferase
MITYKQGRGMSMWHDWHDWLGGYPFEVAKPEAIIIPVQKEGFALANLNTQYGTMGCVEYVFKRVA